MKNILLLFMLPLLPMITVSIGHQKAAPAAIVKENTITEPVVLELFTSEGCSSCPAADKVLAGITHSYANKVIVLGFHVDYWNRLGWKDRFSDAAYSQRQRQYATAIPGGEVYTPQVVVNGEDQMVGSDQARLIKSIDKHKTAPLHETVTLVATQQKNTGLVQVEYSFPARSGLSLNIALLQVSDITDVQAGENKGLTLHHVNIVRYFTTVSSAGGKAQLRLPEKSQAKDFVVVGYVQENKSKRIIGSTDYVAIQ